MIYTYICEPCEKTFEIIKGMNDPDPKKCPECGYKKIYRDYSEIAEVSVSNEPKTLGALADKNTEKLVKEGRLPEVTLDYENTKKKKAKFNKRVEKFSKLSPKEIREYIQTGKEK